MNLYSGGWNLGLYGLNLSMLVLGIFLSPVLPVIIMGLSFLFWNAGYVIAPHSFVGRDYDHVLAAIRRCRDYMAWFIIFYAIIFGGIITSGKADYISTQFSSAGLNPVFLIIPFFMVTTGVLFVPAKMTPSNGENKEPSMSLKVVFGSTAFLQEYSTFLIALFIGKVIYIVTGSA